MIFLLLIAGVETRAEKPSIQKIKDLYGRIESGIRAGRLAARSFGKTGGDPSVDPSGYEGITGRYFSRRGSRAVDKIAISTEMTNVTIYREYVYYEDGSLALYYASTRTRCGGPAISEERYYFLGDACIRVIEGRFADNRMKREVFDPPLPEHKREAVIILENSRTYRSRCVSEKSPLD